MPEITTMIDKIELIVLKYDTKKISKSEALDLYE
jgi:hypothetical protein